MAVTREVGTPAALGVIPLCVPEVRGDEWEYIKECLDTNWVSSAGSFVDRFEGEFADFVGADHAVATVNGTAALHVALLVAGVRPDDEVLVSTLTFIAPANAVRYAGAWPVFIDAEPTYWQMDPLAAVEFIESRCRWEKGELRNVATGRRVKAILPVHILGHSVDMDSILECARRYNLAIIEDASQGLGGSYKSRHLGTLGDVGCFSFNGNKVITTGAGGMIVTNNEEQAARARYLTTQAKEPGLEYVHHHIGYNYRMSNLLAAMGVAQLGKIDEYIAAKRNIAAYYSEQLDNVAGINLLKEAEWCSSACWLSTIAVDERLFGRGSRGLAKELRQNNIESRPLWQPLHLSDAHAGSQVDNRGVADRLFRDALSLPSSVGLTTSDQSRVIESIKSLAPTAISG